MTSSKRAPLALAVSAVLGVACAAEAAPTAPSVAIKFGTAPEQTGTTGAAGATVTGPAGVLGTATWNNFSGPNGTAAPLNADLLGASTPTAATVTWSSNNTWSSTDRGEENNTAPAGENKDLMAGYLDTGGVGGTGVNITVANLPTLPGVTAFDVYVYIKGGVNGRGGTYTIGGTTLEHTGDAAFNGTFVEDTLDPGTTAGSNYIVFRGLTGSGFTLTTTPTIGNPARAPVNGIEIVAVVPEPVSLALLGVGAAGLLRRRSGRRA